MSGEIRILVFHDQASEIVESFKMNPDERPVVVNDIHTLAEEVASVPAILITDVMAHQVALPEVVEHVRQSPQAIRILCYTNTDSPRLVADALQTGLVDRCLFRPDDADRLVETMQHLLEEWKPAEVDSPSDTVKLLMDNQIPTDLIAEMSMAVRNAMPGISRLNTEGRYTSVNHEYAAMMNYLPSDLTGESWERFLLPEDLAIAQQAMQRMLDDGTSDFELRGLRKDGSVFYQHTMMVKRSNHLGEYAGFLCLMRDTTEDKVTESALQESLEMWRALAGRRGTRGRPAPGHRAYRQRIRKGRGGRVEEGEEEEGKRDGSVGALADV
jgi:PAS domain S-box-containing protein